MVVVSRSVPQINFAHFGLTTDKEIVHTIPFNFIELYLLFFYPYRFVFLGIRSG